MVGALRDHSGPARRPDRPSHMVTVWMDTSIGGLKHRRWAVPAICLARKASNNLRRNGTKWPVSPILEGGRKRFCQQGING